MPETGFDLHLMVADALAAKQGRDLALDADSVTRRHAMRLSLERIADPQLDLYTDVLKRLQTTNPHVNFEPALDKTVMVVDARRDTWIPDVAYDALALRVDKFGPRATPYADPGAWHGDAYKVRQNALKRFAEHGTYETMKAMVGFLVETGLVTKPPAAEVPPPRREGNVYYASFRKPNVDPS